MAFTRSYNVHELKEGGSIYFQYRGYLITAHGNGSWFLKKKKKRINRWSMLSLFWNRVQKKKAFDTVNFNLRFNILVYLTNEIISEELPMSYLIKSYFNKCEPTLTISSFKSAPKEIQHEVPQGIMNDTWSSAISELFNDFSNALQLSLQMTKSWGLFYIPINPMSVRTEAHKKWPTRH